MQKLSSTGELALLVEGLGVGGKASMEEYIVESTQEKELGAKKDTMMLYMEQQLIDSNSSD